MARMIGRKNTGPLGGAVLQPPHLRPVVDKEEDFKEVFRQPVEHQDSPCFQDLPMVIQKPFLRVLPRVEVDFIERFIMVLPKNLRVFSRKGCRDEPLLEVDNSVQ